MNTIVIDMDKKCTRCGRPGALKNGICMTCFSKAIASGELDHILKPKQSGSTPSGQSEK